MARVARGGEGSGTTGRRGDADPLVFVGVARKREGILVARGTLCSVGNAAGDRTRAALIRAGERQMADHGIEGAELQDVVALAGQRNRSAVVFHFGSRDGLLRAIVA